MKQKSHLVQQTERHPSPGQKMAKNQPKPSSVGPKPNPQKSRVMKGKRG